MRTASRLGISLALFVLSLVIDYAAMGDDKSMPLATILGYVSGLLMACGAFGIAYVVLIQLTPYMVAKAKNTWHQNAVIYGIRVFGAIGILWALT